MRSSASSTPPATKSGPASSAPTDSDQANGVAVDASGIYLAGITDGTFPGQTSNPDQTMLSCASTTPTAPKSGPASSAPWKQIEG